MADNAEDVLRRVRAMADGERTALMAGDRRAFLAILLAFERLSRDAIVSSRHDGNSATGEQVMELYVDRVIGELDIVERYKERTGGN